MKSAKRLKPNTLKNYSDKQLLKHLDRLQDHFIDEDLHIQTTPPYRVDLSYFEVRTYDLEHDCYFFYGETRSVIMSSIKHTYQLLGI